MLTWNGGRSRGSHGGPWEPDKGQARIRVQISASHTRAHLDKAINAFVTVGKQLNVI